VSTIGNFEKKNEVEVHWTKAYPLHSIVWLLFELLLASGREQHILKSISGFRII